MLSYLKKFAVDVLPSVAATVIGAYIVNHYINARPAADTPVAAAVSTAEPSKTDAKTDAKADVKATPDGKPVEKSSEVSNLPEAGVKARGMSERTLLERSASEKAAVVEKPPEKSPDAKSADAKPTDAKSADVKPDAPAETASIPADQRRHQPTPRERNAVRVVLPSPVQPSAPAAAPVAAAPSPAPAVEAAVVPDEHRDANDLARAAIERLRGTGDTARPPEAARTPDTPRNPEVARVPEAPRIVTAPAIRPLPPPIMVSTPPSETLDQGTPPKPPYAANARIDDPRRPTPPADIPVSRPPLDLRAEAAEPAAKEHTSVAEDVLSAAKSVFHAVLPK
jgi:hypothetical protein